MKGQDRKRIKEKGWKEDDDRMKVQDREEKVEREIMIGK